MDTKELARRMNALRGGLVCVDGMVRDVEWVCLTFDSGSCVQASAGECDEFIDGLSGFVALDVEDAVAQLERAVCRASDEYGEWIEDAGRGDESEPDWEDELPHRWGRGS